MKFPEKVLKAFLQIAQLHRRGKEATKQFLHARVGDRINGYSSLNTNVIKYISRGITYKVFTKGKVMEEGS